MFLFLIYITNPLRIYSIIRRELGIQQPFSRENQFSSNVFWLIPLFPPMIYCTDFINNYFPIHFHWFLNSICTKDFLLILYKTMTLILVNGMTSSSLFFLEYFWIFLFIFHEFYFYVSRWCYNNFDWVPTLKLKEYLNISP